MKSLIAVHHFPPRYRGGAELRAYRTALALKVRGFQVQVVSVERIDSDSASGVSWVDDDFEGVSVRRLSFNLKAAPDPFLWEYDNPWIGDHLRGYLRQQKPDIFHLISGYLMTASSLEAAQEYGVPQVVSLTDYWFLCPRINMLRSDEQSATLPFDPIACARCIGEEKRRYRLPAKIAPALMDAFWRAQREKVQQFSQRHGRLLAALNQVQVAICPSEFLRNRYIQAGIHPERLIYSRQGHDFPELQKYLVEKLPSPVLRVGYIGQISEHKGVHILFEAVRLLPQLNLTAVAYGDTHQFPQYTKRLQRMVNEDSRLSMAGLFAHKNISEVFKNLDILVVPSLINENSPNVILEALAHHVPVIGSNMGGIPELVLNEENGLLFSPGDPEDLARKLKRFLIEPDLLNRLQSGIQPIKNTASELAELVDI